MFIRSIMKIFFFVPLLLYFSVISFAQEKLVKVNGSNYNILLKGLEKRKANNPIIIFESGMGVDLGNWTNIIEKVSMFCPVLDGFVDLSQVIDLAGPERAHQIFVGELVFFEVLELNDAHVNQAVGRPFHYVFQFFIGIDDFFHADLKQGNSGDHQQAMYDGNIYTHHRIAYR